MGAPALAQAPASGPAVDNAAADKTERDVVIVTALKRETDLQDTPIAISVVNPQLVRDNHIQSLYNLADGVIPSLRVSTFEARQSALTIGMRGIVPFDQNQTARDTGVGTYVDGVYLGRSQGTNAALFDVARIEVLRGPQGTLFGRNTEGGALSIVTKAPTGKFGGRVVAGVGNFGAYNSEIHQDFQEFGGLSLKFDGVIQHQDPTTKNPLAGQAGWNQYHRAGGRLSGLWKPVDGFSAELSVDYAKDENTPFYSQLLNYNVNGKTVRPISTITPAAVVGSGAASSAPAGTINALSPLVHVGASRQSVGLGTVQQPSVDKTGGGTLTMKWEATPDLELRSITAARAVGTNQWDNSGIESRNVFQGNALFGRYSLSDLYQYQYSQEFQAVGKIGTTIDYVAGLFYFTEHAKESAATPFTNIWNADGTNFTIRSSTGTFGTGAITSANQGWEYGTRLITRRTRADSDSFAVYGQATWTPSDPLHITAGGRWTKDTRSGYMDRANNKDVYYGLDYSDSRFDPLLTVAYDFSDDINLYGKYSTGFRAGGANSRSATFLAFVPEEVKAYEGGLKSKLFDGRMVLDLAIYHMDRENTQIDFDSVAVTGPNAGTHFEETANAAGKSKIDGFEAEVTFRATDYLTFGGSYAYTKIEIPTAPYPFPAATGQYLQPGDPFPVQPLYTPENAFSAFVNLEQPLGEMTLRGHLEGNYADAQYSFPTEFADISTAGATAANIRPVAVQGDASFIVNGSIALADINLNNGGPSATISIWARNLLDETFVYRVSGANRGTIGDYGNLNAPRTFGIEASIKY
jgi:iron complex outermembrane receptor protein